jgi:PIN domain nuclease of toxin-antitoxin system
MRILLDSHIFAWAKSAPENLSHTARAAIIDPTNDVFVSVASAWELWIKHAKKPVRPMSSVMLIAQAIVEGLTALTDDPVFRRYDRLRVM